VPETSVLVCVFDGLRRDIAASGMAPTISAFLAAGADFPESRSVFPSLTRVNATAFATGSPPGRSGVTANKFYDPDVYPERMVDTGKREDVLAADRRYGGLVTAPTLGEALAAEGLRMEVLSSASTGTSHLANPHAARLGHRTMCLLDAGDPSAPVARLVERFGPPPPPARPDVGRTAWMAEAWCASVDPDDLPAVTVIWFTDPDSTFHYEGLWSDAARRAVAAVDAAFARIVERCRRPDLAERMQVVAMSDHGHILGREKFDAGGALRGAGFAFGRSFPEGAEMVGAIGSAAALRVAGRDRRIVERLCGWLADQPWCGPVFTAGGRGGVEGGVPGTLDRALVLADHPRGADVVFALRSGDDGGPDGRPGATPFANEDLEPGAGVHGGLHRCELNNTLGMAGSRLRPGFRSDRPAGIIDVAPTVLALLGVPAPAGMAGRALTEAIDGGEEPPPAREVSAEVAHGGMRSWVRRRSVGATAYVDCGGRGPAA
jgi:phosphonoacetate hydrolase